jgi:hypothetical protein
LALTQTEAWYLAESIKGETLMCQKLANYLNQVQDPELRRLVLELQRSCRQHVDMLISQVN